MAWYQIVNAKSDSYVADRDAEDLLRAFSAALRDVEGPVDAEVFYGLTRSGARIYYFSLSPEVIAVAERVLESYDATLLAELPDLAGLEKIHNIIGFRSDES
jgi:hypothetical protein